MRSFVAEQLQAPTDGSSSAILALQLCGGFVQELAPGARANTPNHAPRRVLSYNLGSDVVMLFDDSTGPSKTKTKTKQSRVLVSAGARS